MCFIIIIVIKPEHRSTKVPTSPLHPVIIFSEAIGSTCESFFQEGEGGRQRKSSLTTLPAQGGADGFRLLLPTDPKPRLYRLNGSRGMYTGLFN